MRIKILGDKTDDSKDDDKNKKENSESVAKGMAEVKISDSDGKPWKNNFAVNPDINEYGNKKAEIIDFAVVDDDGLLTNSIVKND